MPRVKRGTSHVKRRKNLLKKTKGYNWGRKKLVRLASTAVKKAGQHALRDRRKKKRTARALWQTKINAAVREHSLTYSRFIDALKKSGSELDRKVLAQLAEKHQAAFANLLKTLK